jgi:hypothetical protein
MRFGFKYIGAVPPEKVVVNDEERVSPKNRGKAIAQQRVNLEKKLVKPSGREDRRSL